MNIWGNYLSTLFAGGLLSVGLFISPAVAVFVLEINEREIEERFKQAAHEHQWRLGQLRASRGLDPDYEAQSFLPEISPNDSSQVMSTGTIASALAASEIESSATYPRW